MQFNRVDKNHAKIHRLGYGRTLLDIFTNRPMDEMGRRVTIANIAHFGGQQRISVWIDETGDDDPKAMEVFALL